MIKKKRIIKAYGKDLVTKRLRDGNRMMERGSL